MKKFLTLVLVVFCYTGNLFAQEVSAEKKLLNEFTISGGISLPTQPGNFTSYWNTGYNVGGGFEFLLDENFRVVAGIEYSNFSLKTDDFAQSSGIGIRANGGGLSIANFSAGLKYMLKPMSDQVTPYLLIGAGFFRFSPSEIILTNDTGYVSLTPPGESALSFQTGAGVDIELKDKENSLFIEAKYVAALTKNEITSYLPIRAGIKFKF